MAKCRDHVTMYLVDNVPLFFRYYEGAYMPTLRVLHKCMLFIDFSGNQNCVCVMNAHESFCSFCCWFGDYCCCMML